MPTTTTGQHVLYISHFCQPLLLLLYHENVIYHTPLHQIYTILTARCNSDNCGVEIVLINGDIMAKTVFVSSTRLGVDEKTSYYP